ncbi:pyridoxal phosphate-dependent aminotransferase [Mycolicibacterium komossense]|uniref:Aminotransferase class I/II-fold pyridoxal phosphate-dependent enzyme n=1 Tax=Mycolicibacterium komossense TaxID=1779 RepID=A0ABT3CIQ9_9MYCO|nr:aminotransferase class I/II-fold pyridoxal phosphate-dependent enzyme [Mycolicibacterium komossense]MCV7229380.1 aminotransferase class I/II-fold pyridoxal phosphate-dependent enzyme [Mycolicibacterium komossense]
MIRDFRRAAPDAAGVDASLPSGLDPLALALNENPLPPLPAVRSALVESISAANRYPEFLPERLRKVIARQIGVDDNQVIPGAGSTGVVLQILHTVTSPGDRIVLSEPTFDGFPIMARMARLQQVTVALDEHGHHDLRAIADASVDAKVVVVCRPHNPTGTVESADDIDRFLLRVPPEAVVLLDEAYIEFVAPQFRLDAVALVRRFPNVVVLRTFSKAYGLAGLRIGYGFGSPELVDPLWSMQLPFGISSMSSFAVAASYGATVQLGQRVRRIVDERRILTRRLRSMGLYTTDGHANFVYLPNGVAHWPDNLPGVLPRVRCYPDGAMRITVGGPESTRAVLGAITAKVG